MNTNILNLHPGVLDENRKKLLDIFSPYAAEFTLGGGTALALQLGHRKSFDFDFFSKSIIQKNLLEKLSDVFSIKNVSIDTPDELTFFTEDAIKITFLHYPFKHLHSIIKFKDKISMFSAKDIAIMKAYTIGRRGEYRDYFDLYILFKNHIINLSNLISEAKNIYKSVFDEKIFLQQLVYFEDLPNFEIIPPGKGVLIPPPSEIRQYFEGLVDNYLKVK